MIALHRPPGTRAAIVHTHRQGPGGRVARVLLGGLGSAATLDLLPALAHPLLDRGSVTVMDWVGAGWSDHDDAWGHRLEDHAGTVVSLLDHLGLRGVSLVGHSFGGSVAVLVAAGRPDLVGHLVVAEPNLDPGVGTFSAAVAGWDEASFVATGHAAVLADLRAASDPTAAALARTLAWASPVGLHRAAVSLLSDRRPTLRALLSGLAVERTFLAGARSDVDLDAAAATGCTVRVVPDAGHHMPADNLEGFCAAVAAC
ncbi:MAG: alpha/beta hydrolase [Pseudonocardia sp.]|nr:alpha/beta hydrolase [Pseudonocardia sp.]